VKYEVNEQLTQDNINLRGHNAEVTQDNTTLRGQNAEVTQDNTNLRGYNAQLIQDKNDLILQIHHLKNERLTDAGIIANSRGSINDLTNQVTYLSGEIAKLEAIKQAVLEVGNIDFRNRDVVTWWFNRILDNLNLNGEQRNAASSGFGIRIGEITLALQQIQEANQRLTVLNQQLQDSNHKLKWATGISTTSAILAVARCLLPLFLKA
jgi:hypothetical protein